MPAMTSYAPSLMGSTREHRRAMSGRVYNWSPMLDSGRRYVTDNLTPDRLVTLLKGADSGNIADMLALWKEMQAKDLFLQGIVNTRRMAVTGLDYEIVSASDKAEKVRDKKLADEAAAYCREQLERVRGYNRTTNQPMAFCDLLKHLAGAIGPNFAAAELIWDKFELVEFDPVPDHRLTMNTWESPEIRITTEDDLMGVSMTRGKFVAYMPNPTPGVPFAVTIARAMAVAFILKHYAIKNWAIFMEVFGIPPRTGTYPANSSPDEKTEMAKMLKNLGTDAWGMFREGFEFQFHEVNRGSEPYSPFINHVERAQAILMLGQNMTTTSVNATGTYSAATVHENVRYDLVKDDLKGESGMVDSQILAPMVEMKYPNRGAAVPHFQRRTESPADRKLNAEMMDVAVNKLHLPLEKDYAYERLGLRKPSDGAADEDLIGVEKTMAVGPDGKPVAPNQEQPKIPQKEADSNGGEAAGDGE